MVELDALRCELIDVGGAHPSAVVARKVADAHIVGVDYHDVGFLFLSDGISGMQQTAAGCK